MKKFYKIILCCFIAGLVLMGVGIALQMFELSTFTYMGDKEHKNVEMVTDSINIELPDNLAKIYRLGYGSDFELVKDDKLEGNNAVIDVAYSKKYIVDVQPKFYDNYYLYNSYTESFSKYNVNCISVGWGIESTNDVSDFEQFKKSLKDFKEKKIYNYDDYVEPELTLRVSEEGYERFGELPEGYDLYSYGGYMTMMKERAEEATEELEEAKEYSAEESDD